MSVKVIVPRSKHEKWNIEETEEGVEGIVTYKTPRAKTVQVEQGVGMIFNWPMKDTIDEPN